jgi:chorismate mutase
MRAIRGAISVERDEPEAVVSATAELLGAMVSRNGIEPDDVVSIVFTATPDLTSEFPAPAARRIGLVGVPLLCAAEIAVPGALPRCVRILLHAHTERGRSDLEHVYLGEATKLKSDLNPATGDESVKGHALGNPQGEVE